MMDIWGVTCYNLSIEPTLCVVVGKFIRLKLVERKKNLAASQWNPSNKTCHC